VNTNAKVTGKLSSYGHNKQIPEVIKQPVLKALAFYPELKDAVISFIFKKNIKSSVMQAQPVFSTLLLKKKNRRYRINISRHFKLSSCDLPITQIPEAVKVGWIVHELGHILDYEHRTNAEIALFGFRYVFSPEYVKEAERVADTYAVERGAGKYILSTKRFILDHADIPQEYKNKIKRLYLSPDVIVDLVKKLEEKKKKVSIEDL
jgi:exoribonuclease R